MLGIWDYMKNSGDMPESENWALDWFGKAESVPDVTRSLCLFDAAICIIRHEKHAITATIRDNYLNSYFGTYTPVSDSRTSIHDASNVQLQSASRIFS